MDINQIKTEAQNEAFVAWNKAGKKASLFCITGFGKNRLALKAASNIQSGKILFLAEASDREFDLRNEEKKWNYTGLKIEFMCYQSAYKLQGQHFSLVIADEIDLSLTPVYSSFYFNNSYDQIMGLTATLDKNDKVNPDDPLSLNKLDLLNKFAPVCYKYTIDQGQISGTARKLIIYKIYHELDKVKLSVDVGTKKKSDITTEYSGYQKLNTKFNQAMFAPDHIRNFVIRNASGKRAKLLYDLPSKIEPVKKLVNSLKTKTILFGNSLDSLNKITNNVISSKKSDKTNEKIRVSFEKGKINLIASFKKLQRGANLTGLDNCIIMSYYSKEKTLIQEIGRLRLNDKLGQVFIFVTKETKEEDWFNKMLENITSFKVISFDNVDDCITKLNLKNVVN